jgi:cytochrome c-type biogenesis protein CcmH
MTFWLILTILIAAAAAIVALPFGRDDGDRDTVSGVDVYKDQLAEIERDKQQGLIDEKEADLARVEIERRILAAARGLETSSEPVSPNWHYRMAMGVTAIVVLGSVGLYAALGEPHLLATQSQARMPAIEAAPANAQAVLEAQTAQAGAAAQGVGDAEALVKRLEDRLAANPDDSDGWRVLGWSYYNIGRYEDSVKAYRRAVDLQKENPALKALLGEAMVKAADGTVTHEAGAVFDEVLAIDANDERARYFKGIAKAQAGDNQGALDEWIALYKAAPAEAEWTGDLRARIEELAQSSGIDLGDRLGDKKLADAAPPSTPGPNAQDIENAKQLSTQDQQAMVRGMVERLASRLETSPEDAEGWIMLIRSRMVLNQPDEARAALERATKVFSGTPETQTRITKAAQAMGVR